MYTNLLPFRFNFVICFSILYLAFLFHVLFPPCVMVPFRTYYRSFSQVVGSVGAGPPLLLFSCWLWKRTSLSFGGDHSATLLGVLEKFLARSFNQVVVGAGAPTFIGSLPFRLAAGYGKELFCPLGGTIQLHCWVSWRNSLPLGLGTHGCFELPAWWLVQYLQLVSALVLSH